ncbi:L-asparaginase [Russula earlei]|uniref:L-asparaginase n=1 Tax=Russula earlei TaxID=71964 RepID=A0ACC0U1R8_9AGAM|nr:L-asparaginase [Russula earlei]
MDLLLASDESRVLIIYTGGTIGMLVGEHGYVPEPYFLTETLHSQARFHDPLQDSLFSHSGSVEGFRQWSSSGRTSPSNADSTPSPVATRLPPAVDPAHIPPRSAMTAHFPQVTAQPRSIKISDDVYESRMPALITPPSVVHGGIGKRIRYAVLEWNPLMDSSNIEIDDWIRIATEIEMNYTLFDAFVILHGTDTMAYTSSALSFLLEDLGKTVIVTGAQIPLSQLRNDAVDNLLSALIIAGHYIIPECCLFFNHTLFRGNRVSKSSSMDFNAFTSPNFPPLVNVGIDIVVNWNDVIRQKNLRRFTAHKTALRLFPGITVATVQAFLAPPVRGVVLETFGAGNAPHRKDLMSALCEACERGVVIVAITQCAKGSVSDAYATGRKLLSVGVVPGGDMTPECALTKLSYLLSKTELSTEQVRSLLGAPLRGELTRSPRAAPAYATDVNLETISDTLSHVVRLTARTRHATPAIVVSDVQGESSDAGAPWAWTAAEAATAQSALLSWLVHLSAATNDVGALSHCLSAEADELGEDHHTIAGGILNWINPASGRSPLHVAAMNGSAQCVHALLEAGSLVHLRDSLGHTALYYAARQGHDEIVSTLVSTGANLSGADLEGFAPLAVKMALLREDSAALKIWEKAGIPTPDSSNPRKAGS